MLPTRAASAFHAAVHDVKVARLAQAAQRAKVSLGANSPIFNTSGAHVTMPMSDVTTASTRSVFSNRAYTNVITERMKRVNGNVPPNAPR